MRERERERERELDVFYTTNLFFSTTIQADSQKERKRNFSQINNVHVIAK
jgi:hypothetical protein